MSSKCTVKKIARFVDECSSKSISTPVRDLIAQHLLDSIGCAIGAMGAKVTTDIKTVVDVRRPSDLHPNRRWRDLSRSGRAL